MGLASKIIVYIEDNYAFLRIFVTIYSIYSIFFGLRSKNVLFWAFFVCDAIYSNIYY